MIRVSGLQQQEQSGHGGEVSDDGAGPSEQLGAAPTRVSPAMQETIDQSVARAISAPRWPGRGFGFSITAT